MKKELIVLLPAYNEEENIEKMVASWIQGKERIKEEFNLKLKIVIINDGSKDRTRVIAEELVEKYGMVSVIHHENNMGLGAAAKTGFAYVVNECPNAQFACLMDCDNTQHPKYVLSMLRKIGVNHQIEGKQELLADVVIASRYENGAKVKGVAKHRLLTSEGAKVVYSGILRVPGVKDYTCGYRLYTKDILEKAFTEFGERFVEETGFTCMAEILYKLYAVGARFLEVPFTLRYDKKEGESKMKVVKTAARSLGLTLRMKGIKIRK